MAEKDAKIQAKVDRLQGEVDSAFKKQMEAEIKIKEERAAAIAAKNAELAAEAQAAAAEAEAEEAPETEAPEASAEEQGAES